jgi:hypothetical protein
MEFFIYQGSMRKLIDILSIIEEMHIKTYGVTIDKTIDKYKLFVLMSNTDWSLVHERLSNMEDFFDDYRL